LLLANKKDRSVNKTRLLKQYILDSEILIMPGAHDALTAKIIEAAWG